MGFKLHESALHLRSGAKQGHPSAVRAKRRGKSFSLTQKSARSSVLAMGVRPAAFAVSALLAALGCSRASAPVPAAGTSAASATALATPEPPPAIPAPSETPPAPAAAPPPSASAASGMPATPPAKPGPAATDDGAATTAAAKEEFRAFVASRQACSAAGDCSIVHGSCP